MRNVAVWLASADSPDVENEIVIADYPVLCGEVSTEPPIFDPRAENHSRSVFVRILGFSCNYRDRSLISLFRRANAAGRFYVIGSEFVGEVVAIGVNVNGLAVGDRVIADNTYVGASTVRGTRQGIPTNHSSKEFGIFASEQLFKIGRSMPVAIAASFGVAAQTVYSMIRKARVDRGARVLITGGRSNTSLFAIAALRQHQAEIIVVTRSAEAKQRFIKAGAHHVVILRADQFTPNALSRRVGRVDIALDPFADIYLPMVVPCLAAGGRYVTCGVYAQGTDTLAHLGDTVGQRTWDALTVGLVNNVEIHLNCLGMTGDLNAAYQDYVAGLIDLQLDSVHSGGAVRDFLLRTYVAGDRWGKVAYLYD